MGSSIRELVARGASPYEVEKELGLSPAEVAKLLLSLDGPRRIPKLDIYIYLHERGLKREEVMEVMGIDKETYYAYRTRAIKRRGYKFQRMSRTEELIHHLKSAGSLGIDEIAKRLGLKRSSALQVISRARRKGFVETSGRGENYRVYLKV